MIKWSDCRFSRTYTTLFVSCISIIWALRHICRPSWNLISLPFFFFSYLRINLSSLPFPCTTEMGWSSRTSCLCCCRCCFQPYRGAEFKWKKKNILIRSPAVGVWYHDALLNLSCSKQCIYEQITDQKECAEKHEHRRKMVGFGLRCHSSFIASADQRDCTCICASCNVSSVADSGSKWCILWSRVLYSAIIIIISSGLSV